MEDLQDVNKDSGPQSVKILEIGKPNCTGRTYTTEAVECIVADNKTIVYGKLGIQQELHIDPINISHAFTNLRVEDGYLVGDIQFLNTELGQMLKTLMAHTPVGFSLLGAVRAAGSTITYFKLISINAVPNGVQ